MRLLHLDEGRRDPHPGNMERIHAGTARSATCRPRPGAATLAHFGASVDGLTDMRAETLSTSRIDEPRDSARRSTTSARIAGILFLNPASSVFRGTACKLVGHELKIALDEVAGIVVEVDEQFTIAAADPGMPRINICNRHGSCVFIEIVRLS